MKVVLHTARVGPGIDQQWGDVVDIPDAEAHRLIQTNQARPHEQTDETATGRRDYETAARRTKRAAK